MKMKESTDNKYFRHKRKTWARRLNENCENKDCKEFREWDSQELFPYEGSNVSQHC